MALVLAVADEVSLGLAVLSGFAIWRGVNPAIPPLHPSMGLAVLLPLVAFLFRGLYPGIGLTAVEEIRRLTLSVTLVYLLLSTSVMLVKEWSALSRGAFVLSWAFSVVLVPLVRWVCATGLSDKSWWGVPVMVLGAGETARSVIRLLRANQILGYRPLACFDDDPEKHGSCEGVPVAGTLSEAETLAEEWQVRYAIVAMPGVAREMLVRYLHRWRSVFPHVILVPNLFGVASLWTEPRDLGGVLGLEIQHNLLKPANRWLKRALDLVAAGVGLAAAAPLLAAAAIWIKRASPGPALYTQERQGRDGRPIRILKLRTMHPNAEQMLERHLLANSAAREEWSRFCKLKRDPRVIPGIGAFLRKSSLDEVPQLWNILKGEMSLVGPRPFPSYHNDQFDEEFRALRTEVTPGLTGLWQVSARSDGDFGVQASLDSYYIRNWSLWLDLYILIRTARTVLAGNGAY